jgi:predicted nucleic acid-binding protein
MSAEPIFVDTSAFYALLDRSDRHHEQARAIWPSLLEDHVALLTTNYVALETLKLLQYRISSEAARVWYRDVLDVLEVCWINEGVHRQAFELWMNLGRQHFSLVDCASYITMHQHQVEKAFCFKNGFEEQGFHVIPELKLDLKHCLK